MCRPLRDTELIKNNVKQPNINDLTILTVAMFHSIGRFCTRTQIHFHDTVVKNIINFNIQCMTLPKL